MMGSNICFKGDKWKTVPKSSLLPLFSSPEQSPGRAIVLPLASALALAKSLMLKLVFYVLGKVLSGKLSCPCDRSCYLSTGAHGEQCR